MSPLSCGTLASRKDRTVARRGNAIHALSRGVPLNMLSKWMGHSQMETTAIYANAVGEE